MKTSDVNNLSCVFLYVTVIISFCWFLGGFVGFLPLLGWHSAESDEQACFFVEVMDYNYLVFLYIATIIIPAMVLLGFYVHIYTVIIRQVRQTVTFNSAEKSFKTNTCSYSISKPNSGTMLRVLGAARKREVKATQNLSIIVIFFMMCWLPLYTINCIKAFCADCYIHPRITFAAIILSHLNSAVNPLLYAYNLKDFRAAMKTLILKMIGRDVIPVPSNLNYRFSIASQHRIQTLVDRQQSGSRIYVGEFNTLRKRISVWLINFVLFFFVHIFWIHAQTRQCGNGSNSNNYEKATPSLVRHRFKRLHRIARQKPNEPLACKCGTLPKFRLFPKTMRHRQTKIIIRQIHRPVNRQMLSSVSIRSTMIIWTTMCYRQKCLITIIIVRLGQRRQTVCPVYQATIKRLA